MGRSSRSKRSVAVACAGAAILLLPAEGASAIPWDAQGALAWHQTPAPLRPDPNCTQSYDSFPPSRAG